jgi:MFS-type transporter involved in bile tolerance (Atg22 family)
MNNFLLFSIWVTLIAILLQLSGGSLDSKFMVNVLYYVEKIIISKPFITFVLLIGFSKLGSKFVKWVIENIEGKTKEKTLISQK